MTDHASPSTAGPGARSAKTYLVDRIVTPLGVTIAVGLVLMMIIISVSRVLLALDQYESRNVAVAFAAVLAIVVFGTAMYLTTRPRLSSHTSMGLLGVAGLVVILAGLISADRAEPRKEGEAIVVGSTVQISAGQNDAIVFSTKTLSATVSPDKPGVEIDFTVIGGAHSFVIDEPPFRLPGTGKKAVALVAGAYTFYCDVSGHRAQGMEGTLTVTAVAGTSGASGAGATESAGEG